MTSEEDVIRNTAKEIVSFAGGDDGAESVFQIVPTSSLQIDAVEIEPGAPECTAEPVYVSVEHTASVVTAGDVDNVLNCSIS